MGKDNLEELLREKLVSNTEKPPKEVWARLDKSLADLRREGSFNNPAAYEEIPDVGREIRIRKPVRHKVRWAYIAASVSACIIAGTVLFNLKQAGLQNGWQISETEAGIENREITSPESHIAKSEEGISFSELEPKSARTSSPTATHMSRKFFTVPLQDEDDADRSAGGFEEEEIRASDTESQQESPNNTDGRDKKIVNNSTSDTRRERFAVMNRDAERRHIRRTTPVSASLFAVNTGAIAGGGNVKSGSVLSSDLIVNEYTDAEGAFLKNTSAASITHRLKHDLPLTFGASITVGLVNHLSIQTGINYTYMKSEAESGLDYDYSVKQKLHYLGIPVSVKFDFLTSNRVDLYLSAGGALEKCVSGVQIRTTTSKQNVKSKPYKTNLDVKGFQASVGANIGAEVKIDNSFGIYAEPGIGYFFKNSKQPESYRTENPLSFTLRAGLRLHL